MKTSDGENPRLPPPPTNTTLLIRHRNLDLRLTSWSLLWLWMDSC